MDIKFLIADESHVEGIIKLCNECFGEETDILKAKRVFEETKNDQNQIYVIGVINGEIVAHTKIAIIPTMFDGMDSYAILNHVCVRPDYRKRKLGTKMLEEVEQICKEKGCDSLKLWSNNVDYRIAAHECYKKFGFLVNDAKFFSKKI